MRCDLTPGSLIQVASTAAPLHRLAVDDVLRMVQAGVLEESARVELVEGVLVDLNPTGPEHEDVVAWLNRHFARPDAPWQVRVQSMLVVPGGYVLPDLLLIPLRPRGELPSVALMTVEVAQSSHRRDAEKLVDYARIGVPEYWIVDVVDRVLLVHRRPEGERYADVERFTDGETVQPLVDVPPVSITALFDD